MKFHVIDKKTGKAPDFEQIARYEAWAAELDLPCEFALIEGGQLIVVDDCAEGALCPKDRFEVYVQPEESSTRIEKHQ